MKIITIKSIEIRDITVPDICPINSISEIMEFLSTWDTDGFDLDNFTIEQYIRSREIIHIKQGGSNETNNTNQWSSSSSR